MGEIIFFISIIVSAIIISYLLPVAVRDESKIMRWSLKTYFYVLVPMAIIGFMDIYSEVTQNKIFFSYLTFIIILYIFRFLRLKKHYTPSRDIKQLRIEFNQLRILVYLLGLLVGIFYFIFKVGDFLNSLFTILIVFDVLLDLLLYQFFFCKYE